MAVCDMALLMAKRGLKNNDLYENMSHPERIGYVHPGSGFTFLSVVTLNVEVTLTTTRAKLCSTGAMYRSHSWESGSCSVDERDIEPSLIGKDGEFNWVCNIPAQGTLNLLLPWEVVYPMLTVHTLLVFGHVMYNNVLSHFGYSPLRIRNTSTTQVFLKSVCTYVRMYVYALNLQ